MVVTRQGEVLVPISPKYDHTTETRASNVTWTQLGQPGTAVHSHEATSSTAALNNSANIGRTCADVVGKERRGLLVDDQTHQSQLKHELTLMGKIEW